MMGGVNADGNYYEIYAIVFVVPTEITKFTALLCNSGSKITMFT